MKRFIKRTLLIALTLALFIAPRGAAADQDAGGGNADALKYRQQAQEALDAGNPDKALSIVTEALLYVNGPAKADIYATRALVYYQQGKTQDALAEAARAIELSPENPLPIQTRGMIFFYTGEPGMAVPDLDKAISLGSSDPAAFVARGFLYTQRNNPGAAIKLFSRAIEIDSEYTDAYINRGYARSLAGLLQDALNDYEFAVEKNPSSATAYNDRGIVKSQLGQLDAAISDFKRAAELDPKYSAAYSNLGYTLFEQGDTEAAMKQYDLADEYDKANAYSICNRAEARINLGGSAKAAGAIKRCVKAAEADPQFISDEAYYFESMRRLKKLIDNGEDIPSYGDLIAAADKALAANDRVSAYYNYAVANILKPAEQEPVFGLGKTSLALGRYSRAISFLSEYQGRFKDGPRYSEAAALISTARERIK